MAVRYSHSFENTLTNERSTFTPSAPLPLPLPVSFTTVSQLHYYQKIISY